ncbi:hypothetical protein FHR53_003064 [Xanthomonas arboricola]|uniref:hypothetical protein n=1 Tax=Xanthomonas cannabis TaxID=1885674 RepID=UPI0011115C65|nr:hypothetical protein [Xanthomonas cannabis]
MFLFDSAATQRRRTANHLRPARVKAPPFSRQSVEDTALQMSWPATMTGIKNAGFRRRFWSAAAMPLLDQPIILRLPAALQ